MRDQWAGAKYRQVAPEVVRLHNEGLSFLAIARQLGVAYETVTKAYDFADAQEVTLAIEEGRKPVRNKNPILPEEVYAEIRNRLLQGEAIRKITRDLGVDRSTVRRQDRMMRDGDQGAC